MSFCFFRITVFVSATRLLKLVYYCFPHSFPLTACPLLLVADTNIHQTTCCGQAFCNDFNKQDFNKGCQQLLITDLIMSRLVVNLLIVIIYCLFNNLWKVLVLKEVYLLGKGFRSIIFNNINRCLENSMAFIVFAIYKMYCYS